jgi:hypothetical protein
MSPVGIDSLVVRTGADETTIFSFVKKSGAIFHNVESLMNM